MRMKWKINLKKMLIAAENHNWTQWLLCYTLWHMFLIAHRIPLHSVVLMRGWKFPASISFALLPNHKSKIYRWRSFTTTRVYSKRRALLRISHERIPFKTSASLILINPPESETWTDRQRGKLRRYTMTYRHEWWHTRPSVAAPEPTSRPLSASTASQGVGCIHSSLDLSSSHSLSLLPRLLSSPFHPRQSPLLLLPNPIFSPEICVSLSSPHICWFLFILLFQVLPHIYHHHRQPQSLGIMIMLMPLPAT